MVREGWAVSFEHLVRLAVGADNSSQTDGTNLHQDDNNDPFGGTVVTVARVDNETLLLVVRPIGGRVASMVS